MFRILYWIQLFEYSSLNEKFYYKNIKHLEGPKLITCLVGKSKKCQYLVVLGTILIWMGLELGGWLF